MNKDFFSKQSNFYAAYRPCYPSDLYDFIKTHIPARNLAWDVATGNGQAAVELSTFFNNVHATDLSADQLKFAIQKPNIHYHVELAEACSLPDQTADLITVATAIHWFDHEKFFLEAERVLKPKGLLFAWSYGGCTVNEAVDAVINYFNFEYLEPYWHEGAKSNWHDKYKSLILPFQPISTPLFISTKFYDVYEVMHYMYSWSGVQNYIQQHHENPILRIEQQLIKAWGDPYEKKEIRWLLHSKCAKKQ